ncbi:MAG: HAD family hydrolase [Scytolyngbya sp. HA4215-MV1]|nr:HAD family hydrolase [Scytolyngbya sp. HA4215-MV1]
MAVGIPDVLALDFDGVVCDGLKEYFQTTWKAYCQLWQPIDAPLVADLAPQFYRLRPVIETGWEMPVLLRALVLGFPEPEILQDWGAISHKLIQADNLDAPGLSQRVDSVRDQWIATDLPGWLAEHRFYPGVAEQVRRWGTTALQLFIISTKEGRFIRQLLQQQDIDLASIKILGKEAKRPKAKILQEILSDRGNLTQIWFVEDRLKTLQAVQQAPGLETVKLFLADWGYNTPTEREIARQDSHIQLLSLEQFAGDFAV